MFRGLSEPPLHPGTKPPQSAQWARKLDASQVHCVQFTKDEDTSSQTGTGLHFLAMSWTLNPVNSNHINASKRVHKGYINIRLNACVYTLFLRSETRTARELDIRLQCESSDGSKLFVPLPDQLHAD